MGPWAQIYKRPPPLPHRSKTPKLKGTLFASLSVSFSSLCSCFSVFFHLFLAVLPHLCGHFRLLCSCFASLCCYFFSLSGNFVFYLVVLCLSGICLWTLINIICGLFLSVFYISLQLFYSSCYFAKQAICCICLSYFSIV